jgi:uncharacterized protein YciI
MLMFLVLLKYSENQDQAEEFMEGHMNWVKQGFADGVFLLAGSIQPEQGGAIIAYGASLSEMKRRISADPFVAEKIVSAEILEIDPAKADERLAFLIEE